MFARPKVLGETKRRRMSVSSRRSSRASTSTKTPSPAAPVQVILRVRPLKESEISQGLKEVVDVVDGKTLIFDPKSDVDPFFEAQTYIGDISKRIPKNLQFDFDKILGPEDTNEIVFKSTTENMLDKLLDGYHCTVFAYGSTGSGKTYTMLGSPATPGITPLLMDDLYSRLTAAENLEFELNVSYLEIYNETVRDLLVAKSKALTLMDNGKDTVVADLSWYRPRTVAELMAKLQQGNARRTQHPTDANAESSRSHAVFQVRIHLKKKNEAGQVSSKIWVQLTMIDLAGSERAAVSKNNAARFLEGANINKSLLALGNCINALAEGQKHVPYRNSKLTRLLRGALGGNCCTMMIANVSSSSSAYEDTYNTLKYACRAKKIKNKVCKNTGKMSSANLAEFNRALEEAHNTITSVRAENSELRACIAALEAEKRQREEVVEVALMKFKNLLDAKEAEATSTEMCTVLQCHLEKMRARAEEKKRKLLRLQSLNPQGLANQSNLAKVEEARAAKHRSLDRDLNFEMESLQLATNFTQSLQIDFDHWLSNRSGPFSEMMQLTKRLFGIQTNPGFVASQVRSDYFKEALAQSKSEVEELQNAFCLQAASSSQGFDRARDRHFPTQQMTAQFERAKALIREEPDEPGGAQQQQQENEPPSGMDNPPPQAFLFKDTPFRATKSTHQDSEGEEDLPCTPAAFTLKNTPFRARHRSHDALDAELNTPAAFTLKSTPFRDVNRFREDLLEKMEVTGRKFTLKKYPPETSTNITPPSE